MASPELPPVLSRRIAEAVAGADRRELEAAAARLSAAYRARGARVARSRADAVAYLAYRAPATYAAAVAVFSRLPVEPRSVLDVGAGSGMASWAAAAVWPGIERFTLVEAEREMAALGRELALPGAEWVAGDVLAATGDAELVVASYVLSELEDVEAAARSLWARATGTVVFVEPGTPEGYRRVLAARAVVIEEGGLTVAPCPHDAACPLIGTDWCHFAVRLPREEAHRQVKSVSRGFEDEKFSYAALSREPRPRAEARIIRPPQLRSGHVHLTTCEPDGVHARTFSRREGEAYRRARKAGWGDALGDSCQ